MNFILKIEITIIGVFIMSLLSGQEKSEKEISLQIHKLESDIINLSDSLYGIDNQLVNGEEYFYRHSSISGDPYFGDNSWKKGSVKTENKEFSELWLRYDIFDDVLVLKHLNSTGSFMISLNRNVVKEFTLGQDHFIQVAVSDIVNNFPKLGYYQELFQGELQLLAKWSKYISGSNDAGGGVFRKEPVKIIKKDDVYYKFTGKNSLLKILSDQKELVRKFIKGNAIDVKSASNKELIMIVEYYDSLSTE